MVDHRISFWFWVRQSFSLFRVLLLFLDLHDSRYPIPFLFPLFSVGLASVEAATPCPASYNFREGGAIIAAGSFSSWTHTKKKSLECDMVWVSAVGPPLSFVFIFFPLTFFCLHRRGWQQREDPHSLIYRWCRQHVPNPNVLISIPPPPLIYLLSTSIFPLSYYT